MAKFMVRKSELKNVCKAVNDRKLAELKKEIIEILKKQDEKEFKKAIDYLESQELHFTHLEKSLSGKWIEKAGYGIGTVRVWKGKKYKKIAPGKWARVYEKEGRGTNIAIGKLIAKVNKIDNVEDLMAFVMANKQRFVDENGMDLPIIDKLRAASDIRQEKLNGEYSGYNYGVGEGVNDARRDYFAGKDKINAKEADLHKVSRKFEQIPTTELKQRKAKLERWIENKTKSKRDRLNNVIFREHYQKELDDINAVLDKRNGKKETFKLAEKKSDSKEILNAALKEVEDAIDNAGDYDDIEELEKERQKILKKLGKEEKPVEQKKTFKQEMNQLYDAQDEAWEGFESGSDIKSSPENSKKFYERVKKFVDDNNIKLSQKHYDEIEEMNGHSFNEALELAGAYGEEKKEKALAKNREYSKKYKGQILDLSMIDEFKEKEDMENPYEMTETEKKEAMKDPKTRLSQKYDVVINTKKGTPENNKAIEDYLNERDEVKREFGIDAVKNFPIDPKFEEEKTQNRSEAMKGNKNAYKGGLDKDLIRNANGSSNMYEAGDSINREFNGGLEAIDLMNISDEEKENAKQKLYELSTEELKAQAGAIGVSAAGPARKVSGADKKFAKVQKIRSEKMSLLSDLRDKHNKANIQAQNKKIINTAEEAIKENKLAFVSDGKVYYRNNTKSGTWNVIDFIPEIKDKDSVETKKRQLKDLKTESKKLGFADPKKAKVLDDIKQLQNEIAYMNTDNYINSIKKSLFDGFLDLELIEEDIDDMEEDEEERSLWNDYSAEQPELFNSVELQVREAYNRMSNAL